MSIERTSSGGFPMAGPAPGPIPVPAPEAPRAEAPRPDAPWPDPRAFLRAHEDELRAILRVLQRRRRAVIGTVAAVLAVTLIVLLQVTPRYTATALLMLNTRSPNTVDIAAVVTGLPLDSNIIQTEMDVLRSRALAGRVIARLGLAADPELNPALAGPSFLEALNPLGWIPAAWRRALTGATHLEDSAYQQRLAEAKLTDEFLERLAVENELRTYTIRVGFESRDPEKAVTIANAVAEQYLQDQLEAKYGTTRQVNQWLNERLAELRRAVEQSERAVVAFREEARLLTGSGPTLTVQRLSELNARLVGARVERALAQAELQRTRALAAAGEAASAPAVLASPLVRRLREQEADLMRREAELAAVGGGRDQQTIVAAELAAVRAAMAAETARVLRTLESEVEAARGREAALAELLAEAEGEAAALSRAEIRLAELERDAAANRAIFETFLIRYKETSDRNEFQQPDARIVSPAEVPVRPSYPRKTLVLGLAGVASLFLGLFLAFLIERLQAGFREREEVERALGLPVLRLVPALPTGRGAPPPHEAALKEPSSAYAEALQSVRTALHFARLEPPLRTVLVTSGTTGEGKSTLALSLARMAAQSGQKVALIDADLRRPTIAAQLGLAVEKGLAEFLAGRAALSEVLQRDAATDLHVVPAKPGAAHPQDLLAAPRMQDLVREMAKVYELLIIDSPPVGAVSDALILSGLVDGTLFAVQWQATPRELAEEGVTQLRRAGANIIGAVLTRVDVREQERYGYGYGAYYGKGAGAA